MINEWKNNFLNRVSIPKNNIIIIISVSAFKLQNYSSHCSNCAFFRKIILEQWKNGASFQNQNNFSDFQKGPGRPFLSHPRSGAPVIMTEYASLSQFKPKYPWKCFINCYDYVRAMNMDDLYYIFDRFLKTRQVLNKPRF